MNIALWIVAGLLSAMYLYAGIIKGFQYEKAKAKLKWPADLPRGIVTLIGVSELLGALGLVLPPDRDSARAHTPRGVRCIRSVATRTLLTHAAGTVGCCVCFFAAKHQHEDVLDDLHAVIERVRPAPTRNRRTGAPDGLRARTPSRWLGAHPWQGVVLIAVAGGLALALSQALGEGLPGTVRRALLVLGVFTGIEAAGICLGYVSFRCLLGLRRAD